MLGLQSGGVGIMAEQGPEMITPMGRAGGETIIYNYFQGSLLTDRMLYKINAEQQKRNLQRRNFRPPVA